MSRSELDLLRETFERLPEGLMVLRPIRDHDGAIVDFEWRLCNRAAAELLGLGADELGGELLLARLPEHRDHELFDRYVRVVETGEPCEHEFRHVHGQHERWLLCCASRIDGGLSILLRDVSERRRLGRTRADRWRLLEGLFMQAPFAISVVHGPEHRFLLANPEYERMVDRGEIAGRALREVFPEFASDAPIVRVLDEVRASGAPFRAREFAVPLRIGELLEQRYFQFSCAPVRDELDDGALLTVAVDVSDQVRCRQRAEAMAEALELNERRFEATFETAAVGIAHLSPEGQWLRFNDRVAQMLGYSREQLQKLRFHDITHPDDLPADIALANQLLRGEIPSYQLEKRYRRRDGGEVWVNLTGSLVRDEAGRPLFFVAVMEDISERKAAEAALRAADRQKDEFLAMLSHELRNPLAAIRSAGALLDGVEVGDPGDPIMARVRAVLGRQTGYMAHLLDELLDLARVTQGKLTIVPSVLDLAELAREVIADLPRPADSPRLSVALPDEALWVEGDRVRLAQVIHSLLSNALEYTPSSGSVRLELARDRDDSRAVVRVADTGVGLDPELREHLFEPFSQGPQTIARSTGGLGLGLALAKTIVELHHGSIDARSPGPGQGSVFEVRIPLTTAEHPTVSEQNAPESHPARVMIVEDNEDAAELLAALLRARDFDVELASGGEQALRIIRSWRPDAVICDIGLPDIDGYTVARTIRADPELAAVKLVALSGYGQVKDRMRAAEAGFDQHLTKPAAIDAVVRAIGC